MTTIIYLCGLYSLVFALFHIGFWKMFQWKSELKKLNFANKGIMQILNVQLIYYFIFVAFICFTFPSELLTTKFGNLFLAGTSVFWFIRTIQQFIFLRANNYKIHILTFIFLVGTILFALPLVIKIGTSKNPKYREKTLHSQEPKIDMIALWKCDKKVEKELHVKYREKRIRGEWFDLKLHDLKDIEEYMKINNCS